MPEQSFPGPKKRPRGPILGSDRSEETEEPPEPARLVHNINIHTSRCPQITVDILGTSVSALLDSGASATITNSRELIKKHHLRVHPANVTIKTADGTPYECEGVVLIPFTFHGCTNVIPTLLVPQIAKTLILGINFWEAFEISPAIFGKSGTAVKLASGTHHTLNILEEYFGDEENLVLTIEAAEVFVIEETEPEENDLSLELPTVENPCEEKIGAVLTEHTLTEPEQQELREIIDNLKGTSKGKLGRTILMAHKINLVEGAQPKKPPQYRCSPQIQKEIDREIERMKELDVIEESSSEWCNPLLPVKKSSGEWRICLDCRRVNEVTKNEAYPFPDMLGILGRLEKSKFFSVIDLSKAYWQIPLEESSRDMTSFRAGKHLYRFKVMPFGLKGAPITQTKLMNKVLGFDLEPQVHVYLDDIIITSKTLPEHFQLLRKVTERLKEANLSISLSKSRFCQKRISYLGYTISEEGLAIDSRKVQPILDYPTPRTPKEIRRFMGMVSFYKQFIDRFSDLTAPITDLLKGKKKLEWTKAAEQSFLKIKSVLVSPDVLANPDFNLPFVIESDASDVAVGAVLLQVQDGNRRPIAFFSKKLSDTQQKYAPTEKECLGVILAIEKFRHYVEGSRFTVITDAQSLIWLKKISAEGGSAKLIRWALKLQQYDFELLYRKGALNVTADAMSRAVDAVSTRDLEYEKLKKDIINNEEQYKNFKVVNGKIYKLVSSRLGDSRFEWKYVPEVTERIQLMQDAHNEAHFGRFKTLRKLQERYYWPRMQEDVNKYCRGCDVCQRSKYPNTNRVPLMGRRKVASVPWQVISVDFVGPFPRSINGNTMLLVVTDLFSKFVVIQPMREAKTGPMVTFLENMIFLLLGVPEIVISDNGVQFTSKEFDRLLKRYHITHWRNANYHPANNPTERVNRVIVAAIRTYLKGNHREWDKDIHKVAMAIRTAVHESTNFTPYFVNHGRNYISSGKEYRELRESGNETDYEPAEINENLKEVFESVKENLKKAYTRYAKHYNLRANKDAPEYDVGEIVMKKNFVLSNKQKHFSAKLANTYSEAKVVGKIGNTCYDLEDMNGNRLGVFHASDLQKKH